jgi:zinc protease
MNATRALRGTTLAFVAVVASAALAAGGASAALHPPLTRVVLKNGMVVIVAPTARLPLVDYRLVVRAGSVDDPPGKEGLASVTADLLTQGAGPRNAQQIAEDIAFVGGSLEASAGAEQTVITSEVLAKDRRVGLELLHDVAVHPTFPDDEFARKKDEALGGIAARIDDPATVAADALGPLLFARAPLGHPAEGWAASVGTLTRADVAAFHARHFRPDAAILAVVGDVDPRAVVAEIERAFADWKAEGTRPGDAYTPVPQTHGHRVVLVNKPEVTQAQIRLACMGVPRNHPDYYPIVVANTILGDGFTSRLVNEIRVVQGLAYGISSRFGMYRNAGTFGIATSTRNETLRRTIDESMRVLKALLDQGPTPDELDKAKRYLTGQFPLGLQGPDDLAEALTDIEFFALEPTMLDTFQDRVNAVTMADARRALKSYFCLDDLKIVVVGNPATARPALEGLGPIEVAEPR